MISSWDSPVKMVLHHGNHRVLDVLLVRSQLSWHLLLELLGQGLDDHVAVGDLLSVELNEGQEALLGAVLALVVHILQNEIIQQSGTIHQVGRLGRRKEGSRLMRVRGRVCLVRTLNSRMKSVDPWSGHMATLTTLHSPTDFSLVQIYSTMS